MLDELLARCTFPITDQPVTAAFSGGPDSSALLVLAGAAGLRVTAHHVDHGLRPTSVAEARQAVAIADRLGIECVVHRVELAPGANLEARARRARIETLPEAAMTGHTADDQAETVMLRLLRGAGASGLAAIRRGPRHPLLGLRRSETHAVCDAARIEPVIDPSNASLDPRRNRVRHELLPLMAAISDRDPVPLLVRTADLLGADELVLDTLAAEITATDARALTAAPAAVAHRALRRWLSDSGYPPDRASIERVMDVARGHAVACELDGGRRVERSQQTLRLVHYLAGDDQR